MTPHLDYKYLLFLIVGEINKLCKRIDNFLRW